MQRAKRCMFSMRNGVVADALRKGGSPFQIIFGVNLPQLIEISGQLPHSAELAVDLWQNTTTRESMLLAPMLMPPEEMTLDMARQWAREVPVQEVADILCHRLLRHMPYAGELARELIDDDSDMVRYTGLRLLYNLLSKMPQKAKEAAQKEVARECKLTKTVALALIDDADFILG